MAIVDDKCVLVERRRQQIIWVCGSELPIRCTGICAGASLPHPAELTQTLQQAQAHIQHPTSNMSSRVDVIKKILEAQEEIRTIKEQRTTIRQERDAAREENEELNQGISKELAKLKARAHLLVPIHCSELEECPRLTRTENHPSLGQAN